MDRRHLPLGLSWSSGASVVFLLDRENLLKKEFPLTDLSSLSFCFPFFRCFCSLRIFNISCLVSASPFPVLFTRIRMRCLDGDPGVPGASMEPLNCLLLGVVGVPEGGGGTMSLGTSADRTLIDLTLNFVGLPDGGGTTSPWESNDRILICLILILEGLPTGPLGALMFFSASMVIFV